jgi:hypothetical protein
MLLKVSPNSWALSNFLQEVGIRMDLREIGLGSVDWIRVSQDRDRWRAVVSAVEPSGSCATELVLVSYNR